jgi:hypothetical protein
MDLATSSGLSPSNTRCTAVILICACAIAKEQKCSLYRLFRAWDGIFRGFCVFFCHILFNLSYFMIYRRNTPGNSNILTFGTGKAAEFVGRVCAVQYDGSAGRVPVHALYRQNIPYGYDKNALPPVRPGRKTAISSIADCGLLSCRPRLHGRPTGDPGSGGYAACYAKRYYGILQL